MELSKQVVSLDLAKRLKELGIGKERGASLFVWVMDTDTKQYKLTSFENPWYGAVTNYYAAGFDNEECPMYSAFTVAELSGLIPDGYFTYRRGTSWFTGKDLHQIAVAVASDTEANAKAALLIWLLENKLITL